jgi:hypothetical protein
VIHKVKVKVTQVCRVTRETVIEVDAEDTDSAMALIQDGEIDLPNHDDAVWQAHWDLLEETAEPESPEEDAAPPPSPPAE